ARDSFGKIHFPEILLYRIAIYVLARDASAVAQPSCGWMRVGNGQGFVGKPAIGDEASRARGAHDVATPKCVDTENCICDKSSQRIHANLLIILIQRKLSSASRTIRTDRVQQTATRKRFGTQHCWSRKASESTLP